MLFGSTIHSLERALDYSSAKNRAISNNIANADTPGYKAQRVSFQEQLEKASLEAKKNDHRHLSFKGPQKSNFQFQKGQSYHHNGNGVDMDHEMSELAKNQIYYNAAIDRLSSKFNGIKESIRGGR